MKKILCFVLLTSLSLASAQNSENCSYGIGSDHSATGENITTGGTYEYSSASDFDVPARKIFTAKQLTFNVVKGAADLNFVNVYILKEMEGAPGEIIKTFTNLIPTSQLLDYEGEGNNQDTYKIKVDFPTAFDLPKGKYFVQLQASSGDNAAIGWEITNQETTKLGRFDFTKFDNDPFFGGFSYYDHVFSILGTCASTGEPEPNYGAPYAQPNPGNNYENSAQMRGRSIADDFIVPEGQQFTFTKFTLSTLQLGNIKNASFNIRKSVNDLPGEILYSVEKVGPKTENFFGYHTVGGFPLDVVAVDLEFEWNQPMELAPGKYFIEVYNVNGVLYTDYLGWENTSVPGVGSNSLFSYDGGETWETDEGYNGVFKIDGFTKALLSTNDTIAETTTVYPNPVTDILNIRSKNTINKVTVFNAVGQVVKTIDDLKDNRIDLSNLPSGIYFVKTTNDAKESQSFKIIKK